MTRFLTSRVLSLAFVLWLVTIIAFVMIRLAPGDPSAVMLGSDATPKAVAVRGSLGPSPPSGPISRVPAARTTRSALRNASVLASA